MEINGVDAVVVSKAGDASKEELVTKETVAAAYILSGTAWRVVSQVTE